MNNELKSIAIVGGLMIAIAAIIGGLWYLSEPVTVTTNLTPLAQCLAQKQVTMYGAYWCPHCQDQKKLFGDAFHDVPYVECTSETKRCEAKGVQGFPTWFVPDGKGSEKKLVGEQTLETLSRESGCPLPTNQ